MGRFKGSHVQIHGKLKKPVLMRRSGVGSIRESTTQPMTKSEAASMHVSQVPLGIPISAIDSDGEEDDDHASKNRDVTPPLTKPLANNSPSKNQRSNRLGVNTPPLSDDSHKRRQRKASKGSDSDSDDSDTQLPWARSSLSSTKSSRVASTDYTHETNNTQSGNSTATNHKIVNLHRELSQSHLPPSPISSAESPIHARSNQIPAPAESRSGLTNNVTTSQQHQPSTIVPRIRAPGSGHTSNQSSIATTATSTSESEEDSSQRRDQTFSIYDVYGRDSVAFPNFDFRNLNHKGGKLTSAKSNDSLSAAKSNSPLMQNTTVMRGMPANLTLSQDSSHFTKPIPAALRSPSGRRPTAAPALVPMATNLRRKVEANASPISSPIGSPDISSPNTEGSSTSSSQFGTFDPRRRPSLGTRLGGHPTLPDLESSRQVPLPDNASVSPNALGSNLLARRMQEASLANSKPNPIPGNLRVDTSSAIYNNQRGDASTDSARSPNRPLMNPNSPNRPMNNSNDVTMNTNSPTFRPIRSSSDDRASTHSNNVRMSGGQLKKNPSNPQPGPHGGMMGLIAPNPAFANNGGLTTPTGSSRSPSPLSFPSPSSRGSQNASPIGGNRMATSPVGSSAASGLSNNLPGPRVLSNAGSFSALRGVNPASVQFDSLGFVVGSSLSLPLPAEDPEEVKQWRQILSENDPVGARKSRKIKKMAHNGIPHSLRKEVWPYLANSSVRRRAGFFEELCKTSLSAKGKKGKEIYYDAIDKDLDRAYPDHRLFMGEGSTGRADLEAILKAYVHYNPIIGYTQGMSLVAGFMLIQMPAEEAFWLLCALLRDVHMEGYYANTMKQLHVDGVVFGQLLQSMDPELAARLSELQVEPINFTPNWFLPLFTRIVPWQTLLRIWDVFLYEGPSFILRAALGIIRIVRDPLMDRRICPEGGEALRLLLHPPQHLLTPANVLPCALSVKLKDGEMRKLSRQASKVVRTSFNSQGRGGLPSTAGAAPTVRSPVVTTVAPTKRS